MEEERTVDDNEQEPDTETGRPSNSDDLADEIHRLVEAMARAARNVWTSEQRLQLENDLRRGLGSIVGSLEEALERFSRSEQGQDLQEQATKVANRVRESELATELKDGLTVGLRSAADEVRKFADSFEEEQAQPGPPQDIPVESENEENSENSTQEK